MRYLVALPIRGEAFFLRHNRYSILVDGGWNSAELVKSLKRHKADLKHIDIVVCTHADGDHVGGLAELWDRGLTVGQFWLPGSWVDVIPHAMKTPTKLADDIISELDKFIESHPDLARLNDDSEQFAKKIDAIASERMHDEPTLPDDSEALRLWRSLTPFDLPDDIDSHDIDLETTNSLDQPVWLKQLKHELGDGLAPRLEAKTAFALARRRVRYRLAKSKIGSMLAEYWLALIDTASNIRAVADQAIRNDVRVRWFDFKEFAQTRFPRGGIQRLLVPLNAVEQSPAPQAIRSYLAYLSPKNRESLIFLSPPTSSLGVLFCSDSPLGDGPNYGDSFFKGWLPLLFPVVATAPHHGSESNQIAYSHLKNWTPVSYWIRAGGSNKHPGPTFKALSHSKRLCTHCPQTGLGLRSAIVFLGPSPLSFSSALQPRRACSC